MKVISQAMIWIQESMCLHVVCVSTDCKREATPYFRIFGFRVRVLE